MAGDTIYNSTDGPLIVDDEGRVLEGRTHRSECDVELAPVAAHIAAGRIVVVEEPEAQADDASDEATTDETPATPQAPASSGSSKGRGRRTSTTTTEEA